MLIDLLRNKYSEPVQAKITLCKSDFERTPICELSEAYKVVLTKRLGDVDEITFNVPYYLTNNARYNVVGDFDDEEQYQVNDVVYYGEGRSLYRAKLIP